MDSNNKRTATLFILYSICSLENFVYLKPEVDRRVGISVPTSGRMPPEIQKSI